MPIPTLLCPNCKSGLPDECRGAFPLHGIHAEYLCPRCEAVIAWEQQRRSRWGILCLCVAIFLGTAIASASSRFDQPARIASFLAGYALVTLIGSLTFVRSLFDPWELVIKSGDAFRRSS